MPRKVAENSIQNKREPAERLELTISAVAFGGRSLGRYEGKVYFVEDALPGEEVLVEVLQDKGRYANAQVLQRLTPAPDAIPAPCPFISRCGGCQWQSVVYEQQIKWKAEFIQSALQRLAGLPPGQYPFRMEASPEPYGYRHRVNWQLKIELDGKIELGYYSKGSHDLVSISYCSIADPRLMTPLQRFSKLTLPPRGRAVSMRLEWQVMADGRILLSSRDATKELWQELQAAASKDEVLAPLLSFERETFVLLERWAGLDFYTQAGQFQQVNLAANHLLRQWVRMQAARLQVKTAVDLYCGSGNLSLALAKDGCEVWGIEAYAPAIATAKYQAKVQGISGAHYFAAEVSEFSKELPEELKPDLLLVDPPRRGLVGDLSAILRLKPRYWIYVSCDPNTLARDLRVILAAGYEMELVVGYDFFPQTYHVETVCLLRFVGN